MAGQYQSKIQQTACDNCGFGRYSSGFGFTVCQNCPVGQYSNLDAGTLCFPCKEGEYQAVSGSALCNICPAGQYQPAQQATNCLICAAGSYQSASRGSSCTVCELGRYQPYSGYGYCFTCAVCSTGQIWASGCDTTTNGVCANCPAGTFVTAAGRFACDDCPVGTYQAYVAQTTCQACGGSCLAGSYESVSCSGLADRVCAQCKPGTYGPAAGLVQGCIGCESGKFQTGAGMTRCETCQVCPPGNAWGLSCQGARNAECTPCGVGTYNPTGAMSTCTRCGAGTYQDGTGGSACKACATCTAGRYLASGCDGTTDGRCETCTVCPRSTVAACGARTDTVCKTDSAAAWWRMTVYAKSVTGMPASLNGLTMVGSTFVQHVWFSSDSEFQAAVPNTPNDLFVSTFELSLRVVQGGTYLFCLNANDWGYLSLNGMRLIDTWSTETCLPFTLGAGLHGVYAQQAEDYGVSGAAIWYQGPDTGNQRVLMPWEQPNATCPWTPHFYPWVGIVAQMCRPGQYVASFDSLSGDLSCRACPDGWAGLNGVYCERCGDLQEPYFADRSSCVCRWPAVMNASGVCVCPDGFRQSDRQGVPCEANFYGVGGLCWRCGAGKFTNVSGSTACWPCEFGKYRLAGQAGGCVSCGSEGWFAPDATVGVCVQCNATCSAVDGWRVDRACPGFDGYRVCRPCELGLPANATWNRNGTECAYDCLEGFYREQGGRCLECSVNRVCPAGFRLTACTELADSHCDTPCEDPDKPIIYSHWKNATAAGGMDCAWECDEGYELRVWDYTMFVLRECARV